METMREVNSHPQNNYQHEAEYLLHVKKPPAGLQNLQNLQNDKPIDLTSTSSSSARNDQFASECKIRSTPSPSNSNANFQNAENQSEVLKAAKLLFSKKTRTLYHWMYPNTPKFQLKSAVTLAWDTMGMQEKQFYISQVLGKFGYLPSSLMVNPQLGYMNVPAVPPQTNATDRRQGVSNVETRSAVSSLLRDINSSWPQMRSQSSSKRRGRPRGPGGPVKRFKTRRPRRQTRGGDEDDFTDDPELRRELEQFQWALHMAEK